MNNTSETMSRAELIAWLESETALRVRLEAQLAQIDSDLAFVKRELDFTNRCLEAHRGTIDDYRRRNKRLECDIDALETENAQLEENALIIASRLYGSVMVVADYPDAYLIDLRSRE